MMIARILSLAFAVAAEDTQSLLQAAVGISARVNQHSGSNQSHRKRSSMRQYCGGGKSVSDVAPPWKTLDEEVHGAFSIGDCNDCASLLQSEGILMSGWSCNEVWSFTKWSWIFTLQRDADSELKPIQPWREVSIVNANTFEALKPGGAGLPAALRGVFWLGGQGTSSALMTFASNDNSDGAWCSHGKLIGNWYRIRVNGDKAWAFATQDTISTEGSAALDLVYDFEFDSAMHPTFATIYLVATSTGSIADWLSQQLPGALNYTMELLDSKTANQLGFDGSVVWNRRSYAAGDEVTSQQYYLTQVVDEDGELIHPAWDKFEAYQMLTNETGSSPGVLYYHSSD